MFCDLRYTFFNDFAKCTTQTRIYFVRYFWMKIEETKCLSNSSCPIDSKVNFHQNLQQGWRKGKFQPHFLHHELILQRHVQRASSLKMIQVTKLLKRIWFGLLSPIKAPSFEFISQKWPQLHPDPPRPVTAPDDREAPLWQAGTGVRNQADRWRGQRRTNNKGALLFSSSGWLGSPLWHEQDKPPHTPSPFPTFLCHVTTDWGLESMAGFTPI